MTIASNLVDALKRQLKAHHMTYAVLAQRIGASEASVKRMFSQKNFTLERLEQIMHAIGIDLQALASEAAQGPQLIARLTQAQEQELIGDVKLLVVAVSALQLLSLADMVAAYRISEAEAIGYLLRLDKIGFLQLLPNNRVKLLVTRTFSWLPDGPIQQYFRAEAYGDYLNASFDGDAELLRLVNVMLSKQSITALLQRLRQVAEEFSQRHQDDAALPAAERHVVSVLLAARPWVPQAFQALARG